VVDFLKEIKKELQPPGSAIYCLLYQPVELPKLMSETLLLITLLETPSPSPLVVKTVTATPPTAQMKMKTSHSEMSPLTQLKYDKTSPLFNLDSNYSEKTGLPTQPLVLYCRPTFHDQFKFLRESVIDQGVLLGFSDHQALGNQPLL
jgi:hypothetical protein